MNKVFTRILNERDSFRKEKYSAASSQNNSEVSENNAESSVQNTDKDLSETSEQENVIQKSAKTQVEIN